MKVKVRNLSSIKHGVKVRNLSRNVTERHLREIFGSCGVVKNSLVAVDRDLALPRGWGVVEFETFKEAKEAVESISDIIYDTTTLELNRIGSILL